jgi:DNA-binding transcriptional ArsR family regulator
MSPSASLDTVLYAVADPTRRRIVERLMRGPARVTDLAAPISMSLNGVSKHLKILEGAGLLTRTCRGREHFLALRPQPIRRIQAWSNQFERFWTDKLDALASQLEKEDEQENE